MLTYLDNSGKEVRRVTIESINDQKKKHIFFEDEKTNPGILFPFL